MATPTKNPSILLIVGGGIAAYKSLELIRLLRGAEVQVRVVLTKAGAQFVTPLSLASLERRKQGVRGSVLADRRNRNGPYRAEPAGRT